MIHRPKSGQGTLRVIASCSQTEPQDYWRASFKANVCLANESAACVGKPMNCYDCALGMSARVLFSEKRLISLQEKV